MEILLASHNDHKANEIRKMLPKSYQLATLNDIQYFDEIIENGDSFQENAWIKSKTAFEVARMPTFSDDSGLCVEALGDAPGIFSARYAGTGNSEDNIQKLLKELSNNTHRKAYFISVICWYDGTHTEFFEGRINGTIIDSLKGEKGFGYDPIFLPDGYSETFAEMNPELKNKISHRAIALQKLMEFLSR